ncbi:MAG TPA: phosphatidate cytidylyltransferase [Candidatus Avipropionibacterium avicola]|uniref:Phosphatidate cytidylyltransferase n=1 Tax=Candidatus Avipropionibacterium avicola TaxID=2840701 RepID=A0A9D1GZ29_9ACTN|nr:phosphatidate cytidylyltransferase [Candidatus Avipropionibacterium avicola]
MPDSTAGPDAPPDYGRAGRDLPAAIGVGVGLGAVVVLTLAFFHWGFVILVALGLTLGAVELHQALARLGIRTAIVPICVGTVAIICVSYLAAKQPLLASTSSTTIMLSTLALTVIAALVWRMRSGPDGFVRDASGSLFIIGYVPLLGSFVALMLAGDNGVGRVVVFIAAVVFSDIGGYVAGVLFGRHPMAPVISPKKSWEGFVGSILFSVAVSTTLCILVLRVDFWVGPVLALVMVGVGTCGDLVESLVKRDIGIKDMSSFIPGHGGVMDRIDSLLLAAPAAWLVMYLLVPGG